jgi:hypothetical protein
LYNGTWVMQHNGGFCIGRKTCFIISSFPFVKKTNINQKITKNIRFLVVSTFILGQS